MRHLKVLIPICLFFIAIGYAAISTSLSLGGSATVASDYSDYQVYFSKVLINGVEDLTVVKSDKIIQFDVYLDEPGDEYSVTYDVTNGSKYFDASISMTCTGGDEKIGVSNSFDTSNMSARSTRTGTLIVKKLKSNSAQSDTVYSITCSIVAQSIDREDVGTGEVQGPYKLITFTYDGVVYNAVEGMTWEVFMESDFNTLGFDAPGGYVKDNGAFVQDSSGMNIAATELIVRGAVYESYWMCCFDAGSKVLMADGSTKNIEDVQVGDLVMSFDENTKEFVAKKVTGTVINTHSTDLVYVNLSNGVRIGMRAYHPLLTTEGWKSLRPDSPDAMRENIEGLSLLEVGDTLVGYGENVTIVSIEQRPEVDNYYTYNLSVEDNHNYVVEGVVAHNIVGCVEEPE